LLYLYKMARFFAASVLVLAVIWQMSPSVNSAAMNGLNQMSTMEPTMPALCAPGTFDPAAQICCEGNIFSNVQDVPVPGSPVTPAVTSATKPAPVPVVCCGSSWFDPSTQLCCDSMVESQMNGNQCCGMMAFDDSTHVCCGMQEVKTKDEGCGTTQAPAMTTAMNTQAPAVPR